MYIQSQRQKNTSNSLKYWILHEDSSSKFSFYFTILVMHWKNANIYHAIFDYTWRHCIFIRREATEYRVLILPSNVHRSFDYKFFFFGSGFWQTFFKCHIWRWTVWRSRISMLDILLNSVLQWVWSNQSILTIDNVTLGVTF